jgi:hypothetical protein
MLYRDPRLVTKTLTRPLAYHESDKFGLSISARSTKGRGRIDVTDDEGERMGASSKRDCVTRALMRLPAAPAARSLATSFGRSAVQAFDLTPSVAPRGHAVRGCEIGIELDRFVEELQRPIDCHQRGRRAIYV